MNIRLPGLQGGRVEQLSSLAVRCSERLCVSFADFYRETIVPLIYEGRGRPSRGTFASYTVVDGAMGAASAWVAALNALLNRSDLKRMTLLPWRETLAPRGVVRPYRTWCPQCLEDQRLHGGIVTELLVWRLSEVGVCDRHGVRLVSRCPFCGKGNQQCFTAYARVGCCRHCGKWLGQIEAAAKFEPVSDMDMFTACASSNTLEISNTNGVPPILSSDVAVRALRDVFFEGSGSKMARTLGAIPSQLNQYATGAFPAPLHLFIRASHLTGASMEQIFVTNAFGQLELDRSRSFELRRGRCVAAYDKDEVRRRLEGSLTNAGSESVHEIAMSMGMTPARLWSREKELAAMVSRAHSEYIARQAEQRRSDFRRRAMQFIQTCSERGVAPTTDEVRSALDGNSTFLNVWKRSVVEEVMTRAFGHRAASIFDSEVVNDETQA